MESEIRPTEKELFLLLSDRTDVYIIFLGIISNIKVRDKINNSI